jgi:polar amino acid transport system substrate-binding protein
MTAILGLLLTGGASMAAAPTLDVRQALAPTGTLRVGLVLGNPLGVIRDAASGAMKGVGFDLGQALAQRLGVPFEPVLHPSGPALLDGAKSGAWDVTFMGVSPARAKEVDFTGPHLEVELGYLIPGGSSLTTLAEVDRPGIRVAVQEKGALDLLLSDALKQAVVVRGSGFAGAVELLRSGSADVLAGSKPSLFETVSQVPGSRVLDGRLSLEPHALAMPKGRDLGAAYARQFVEDAKSEGLVKAAIERVGLRGAVVAPLK